MTKLGIYLTQRSVNKAEIGRRTGLGRQRIGELCNNTSTRLSVEELYKIALAINVDPGDMLKEICRDITLDF
jgi:transcriptional regulator with XRE-family HTH domain